MQTQTQRTILWIVFSMSLLFLWDGWQRHNGKASLLGGPPPATQQAGQAGQGGDGDEDASIPQAGTDAAVPTAQARTTPSVQLPAADAEAVARGELFDFGNDVLAMRISSSGGVIVHAELLEHKETDDRSRNVVLLKQSPDGFYVAQDGLIGAPQGSSYPTHRSPFSLIGETSLGGGSKRLSLAAESGGLRLVRHYDIEPGSYVIHVREEITNTGSEAASPTIYRQITRDGNPAPGGTMFYSTFTGPVVYTEADKFQKVSFEDIGSGKAKFTPRADDGWVGVIQHYFASAWVPPPDEPREYYSARVGENLYSIGIKTPLGTIEPGATTSSEAMFYVGPQDQQVLEKLAPGLELTVDYGWLTILAKPIHWLLTFLHGFVGNWGWSIVALTVVIKTIFFPLQAASFKSMARMKAVAPRLQAMRERYGDDRAKMNQAMMELYKQEKINPLGGCLPILVQIPVFIALYWVLLASVEMRNAPWFGWIQDLASPDPFFILPVIMAVSMYVQTKLNPTPPDPMQARMMTIMPIVFSVMFFFFPAGLVLYWLVNNIYSIAQQWVITRKIMAEK
ncbi:MAG: membrane protein insertase YidC [Burkholderiaceae bacterium]